MGAEGPGALAERRELHARLQRARGEVPDALVREPDHLALLLRRDERRDREKPVRAQGVNAETDRSPRVFTLTLPQGASTNNPKFVPLVQPALKVRELLPAGAPPVVRADQRPLRPAAGLLPVLGQGGEAREPGQRPRGAAGHLPRPEPARPHRTPPLCTFSTIIYPCKITRLNPG